MGAYEDMIELQNKVSILEKTFFTAVRNRNPYTKQALIDQFNNVQNFCWEKDMRTEPILWFGELTNMIDVLSNVESIIKLTL